MFLSSFSSFHVCGYSFFPVFFSFSGLGLFYFVVMYFNFVLGSFFMAVFVFLSFFCFWSSDVVCEALVGFRSFKCNLGFNTGVLFFILSEVCFFFGFFWSFFHNVWFGGVDVVLWPPVGMALVLVDPFSVPFLNTVLLLSSGVCVTLYHHIVIGELFLFGFGGLYFCLVLGFFFLVFQFYEYSWCYYSINTAVFGSIFFLLTGFHGFHVSVGVFLLIISLFFVNSGVNHWFLGYAIWYWHFVDVVWLYLFIFIYWYSFLVL